MRISIPCQYQALVLTTLLAGITVAGCSKGPDRPRAESTAYSSGASRAGTDTVTTRTDTSTRPAQPPTNPVPSAPEGSPANAAGQGQGLKYDAPTNTVTFELIGGPSGFKFNGYANGEATLTVPSKANMVINFVNKDGTPHSAEVISGEGPLPNTAAEPAIPRAFTKDLVAGLPQEGKDVMRFTVPDRGTYRIICGVPGHALSGMWIWLKVDPAAKAPSFGPTKA